MIYAFSSYRYASLAFTSCISCTDVHTGKSTAVSIMLMFILMPHIFLFLFSSWLCHDSQSAMNSFGTGLYSMHTLYCCICRIMHFRHYDNITVSLPIIATNGLQTVMTCTSYTKQY